MRAARWGVAAYCCVVLSASFPGHIGGARHPSVYVATLPAKYNTDLLYDASSPACTDPSIIEELLANPLGRMADHRRPDLPLRQSSRYALDVHAHMQLLRSPLRVLDPATADVVFVPVYATQLLEPHHLQHAQLSPCNRPMSEKRAAELVREFWAESGQLLPLLGHKPHWLFVADLESQLRNGCGGWWGSDFLCYEQAAHLIVTSPEPFAGMHPRGYHWLPSSKPKHAGSVSVPYIGHVHYSPSHYAAGVLRPEKTHLMTMAFSASRAADTEFRETLLRQCSAQPDLCLALSVVQAQPDQADARHLELNVTTFASAYAAGHYCIQPYGDTPTRMGFYDCAALGTSIPVVFDPHLLKFLPFSHVIPYDRFVILLSEHDIVKDPANSLADRIPNPSSDEYVVMQQKLAAYHHVFQYSVTPDHTLVTFNSLLTVHARDDAFTMAFKAVVHNACKRGLLRHSGCKIIY